MVTKTLLRSNVRYQMIIKHSFSNSFLILCRCQPIVISKNINKI